jgi:hypothetical protein
MRLRRRSLLLAELQRDQALDDPRSYSIAGVYLEFGSHHVKRRSSSYVAAPGS